jgi:hypothetical protein
MLAATDPITAEPATAGTAATNPRRIRHSEIRTMQCLLNIFGSPSLGRVLPSPGCQRGFEKLPDYANQLTMTSPLLSSFFFVFFVRGIFFASRPNLLIHKDLSWVGERTQSKKN